MLHWSQLKGFSPASQRDDVSPTLCRNVASQRRRLCWELTAVDLLVSLEQVLLNEAHVALTAPERPLTCMIRNKTGHHPHMNQLYRHQD